MKSPAWEKEGITTTGILWPGGRANDLVVGLVLPGTQAHPSFLSMYRWATKRHCFAPKLERGRQIKKDRKVTEGGAVREKEGGKRKERQ